jgi:RNA polymerase sigma factor (sigma-70 family)
MAASKLSEVIEHLRRAVLLREGADLTDGQLLECFVSCQEPAALEALVRRHGPMVWGVCQRILCNHHDAEDAFQATFLVLVRKAKSIYPRAKVGNWLYGVANQTALKARATRAKRRVRERLVTQMPEPAATEHDLWSDLQPLLDQELSRLPEHYRTAIVLCELEGKTVKEAARQLGIPEGTIASRLARARTMLAKRLARHGLAVSGGILATVLAQKAVSAGVPTPVLSSTIKAVTQIAAGQTAATGLVSAKVAVLTEQVVKAMFLSKLKLTAALLLAASVIVAGIAGLNRQIFAGAEPKGPAAKVEAQAVSKPTDQQTRRDEGPDDAKKLHGEWHIVQIEKNGKAIREDATSEKLIFRGDEVTLSGKTMKYRLDPRKSPRELDFLLSEEKFKGLAMRAIYSLDKGELRLCWSSGPQSPRPTQFKTQPRDGFLLLVLRRGTKEETVEAVKRQWIRPDALPDGNYQLSCVDYLAENTCCLFNLETKDGNQSASLLDTDEEWEISAVRTIISAPELSTPPNSTGQLQSKAVGIRVICTMPIGDRVFEGQLLPRSLEARGYLELFHKENILPATLRATDQTKLKYTSRPLTGGPLDKAVRYGRRVDATRQRASFAKDQKAKADYVKEAASFENEAIAEAPKLFREGFDKHADSPAVFAAAVDAARSATKYHLPAEELRGMMAKADKTAASYGRRWQQEFNLQVAAALAPQKDYAALALEIAKRLEKELAPTDSAEIRDRVLKALATAQAHSGNSAATQESLTSRLAKVEETLDREYRSKIPPFKAEKFTSRKGTSDRAVVLELFTGTQCPPCVAASVAFDALHQTYTPAELVLLQYHLHIPGPDPLTNPDNEARWAYYGKAFPDQAIGVPTSLFNGKPQTGGGGPMTRSEAKYKEYREVIDPLLESPSAAKVSASAVQRNNKVDIHVEVHDLQHPGENVRLRLLLVEETVRYVGPNRVRFHHHVVRSMVGGADGFPLKDKDSKHTATVDLDTLRKSLNDNLDHYDRNWRPFPNADRPLDLASLRLIALVQDDLIHQILQAAQVEITVQGKAAGRPGSF